MHKSLNYFYGDFFFVALQPFSYCMENSSLDIQPNNFFVFNRKWVLTKHE